MAATFSDRSRVIITQHDGTIIKAYCLPMAQRSTFLEHWEDAWEIIKDSFLAQSAAQNNKTHAIAYLWDEGADIDGDPKASLFVWLTREMLTLHGIDADKLDIHQITELLYFAEEGSGKLVDLQFPALPPGTRGKTETGDPYCRLLAMLSMRSGDWIGAKQALENIPYDHVVQVCAEQERLYEETKIESERGERPAPPPLPTNQNEAADLAFVRQEALRKYHQGAQQARQDAAAEALRRKIEQDQQKTPHGEGL